MVFDCEIKGYSSGGTTISYRAAKPGDRRASFSGSMLPFPSEEFAFQDTPNKGTVQTDVSGMFVIRLLYPNSYYDRRGNIVHPYVELHDVASGRTKRISLGTGAAFRLLDHPLNRSGPNFYSKIKKYNDDDVAVEDQYVRLLKFAYPSITNLSTINEHV